MLFHLIGALSEYGKLGVTAIANSPEQADRIYAEPGGAGPGDAVRIHTFGLRSPERPNVEVQERSPLRLREVLRGEARVGRPAAVPGVARAPTASDPQIGIRAFARKNCSVLSPTTPLTVCAQTTPYPTDEELRASRRRSAPPLAARRPARSRSCGPSAGS